MNDLASVWIPRFRGRALMKAAAGAALGAGMLLAQTVVADDSVFPGWDLWQTVDGTQLFGVPLIGVPLGTFDFAGVGVRNTGDTDTIVHRLEEANGPSETIDIELEALQLRSQFMYDPGAGLDFYFFTLQSTRGGPASTGSMTINFGPEGDPHGTFTSSFDVAFDVRKGSLNGPIVHSDVLELSTTDGVWRHEPNSFILPGVNYHLNGVDITNDFWPTGSHNHEDFADSSHFVIPTVPDSGFLGTFGLFTLSGMVLAGIQRSRRS